MLPDYWAGPGSKWQTGDGAMQPGKDFGNVGMKSGGGVFEWHTVPVAGEQTGARRLFRVPKMQMGTNSKDPLEPSKDRTVLMSGFKSWLNSAGTYGSLWLRSRRSAVLLPLLLLLLLLLLLHVG
jgi:hypothetical protein